MDIPGKRNRAKKALAEFEAHNATTAHVILNRAHVDAKLQALRSTHATAQAAVSVLRAAKLEIQTRIDTEAAALHRARDQAGAALLAEIKNGGTGGKAPAVSGERLETLRHALQAADSELVVAESELTGHLAILRAAEDEHAQAVADAHLKALYIAAREYAKALACAQKAEAACGRYFVAPDVDTMAREIQHADAVEADD